MKKCLKIVLTGNFAPTFLRTTLLKHARACVLEGVARLVRNDQMAIMVCGDKEQVEQFLDGLYENDTEWNITTIEVEPFVKDKDYRGIFRIIE
ncbi:MAG TPA: acylphosphatase [Candidatus Bathyarchaeia archaeon]|nr:acylphosphatase [Candidatus Bathyarchaeia archaeon]